MTTATSERLRGDRRDANIRGVLLGRCAITLLLAAVSGAMGCASLPNPPWVRPSEDELQAQRTIRERMERTIKSHMGVRYRLGGTTKKGIDCSGFTVVVFKSAGVDLPRTAEQQYREGRSISKGDLQYGDLVFFNTKKFATSPIACAASTFCPRIELPWTYGITHTGIYVGDGKFAHASVSDGVTYSRLEDEFWGPRYIGARRVLPDWLENPDEPITPQKQKRSPPPQKTAMRH